MTFDKFTLELDMPNGEQLVVEVPATFPPFDKTDVHVKVDADDRTKVIERVVVTAVGQKIDLTEYTKHITWERWREYMNDADEPVIVQ